MKTLQIPSRSEFDEMIPRHKVRIRKTPRARYSYMATVANEDAFGRGDTPDEARNQFYAVRYRQFLDVVERNVKP